jgi:hypothetical protein
MPATAQHFGVIHPFYLTYAHDQRPERLLGWDKAVGD